MKKYKTANEIQEEKMLIHTLETLETRLDYLDETKHVQEKEDRLKSIAYIFKLVDCKNYLKKYVARNLERIFTMIKINIFEHTIYLSRNNIQFRENQVYL